MSLPYLIFSDEKGKVYHHPYLRMMASSLDKWALPCENELIRLPKGSSLFYLPGRLAVGFNLKTKAVEILEYFRGKKVFAAAAFPVPAYLRLYNPASIVKEKKILPLWAYTACGFYSGDFYITAARVDSRVRQSPRFYNKTEIEKKVNPVRNKSSKMSAAPAARISNGVKSFFSQYPANRLYKHLANCALNYNCLAAKNLFLQRWEAPLPTARTCNARCIGCLSLQGSGCDSSHQRINFKPDAGEIAKVAVNHLKKAKQAIVSFGQGCEGEPLLEADVIADSIYKIRQETSRGTINMNTNASIPKKIKKLCQAGIDSFRVSLNSPEEKFYNIYFRPRNYKFKDVLKSIEIAKQFNKFVSINLFVFPGFSDSASQVKSLIKFVKSTGVDMIQWRNLNIDSEYYLKMIYNKELKPQGVLTLLETVKNQFPRLKTGYFNLPKESF
ncbi:MAG: radical SAM protein [Candidatus Omnitrophota bacterium]